MKSPIPVLLTTAILAGLLSSPLLAAHVLIVDPVTPSVQQIAVAPAGDYWLEVEHRAGVNSIDHYNADATLRSREFVPDADEWDSHVSVPELLPQTDGSVLGDGFFCDLWRISADGHLQWRSNSQYPGNFCQDVARSASGAVWQAEVLQPSGLMNLRRRDAVGRDLGPVPPQPLRAITSNPIAVPGSESVWVGSSTEVDGQSLPSVDEIRTDGSLARQWVAPVGMRYLPIGNLLATADGGLIAIADDFSRPGIWLGVLASSGAAQWREIDAQLSLYGAQSVLRQSSGRMALATTGVPGHERGLLFLHPDLSVSGRFDVPDALACSVHGLACGANFNATTGRWQILLVDRNDETQRLHLITLGADGALESDRLLEKGRAADEIDALPSGGWLVRSLGALYGIDGSGNAHAIDPTPTQPVQAPALLGEYRQDGERYAGFASTNGFVFARIDEQGQVLWQKRFGALTTAELPWADQSVQIAGAQVCVFDLRPASEPSPLRCLDRTSGELRFEHQFPMGIRDNAWGTLANGTLVYVDRDPDGTLLLRRRNLANNSVLAALTLPAFDPGTVRVRSDRLTGESIAIIGALANQTGATVAWLGQDASSVHVMPLSSSPAEFFPLRDRLFLLQARFRPFFSALDLQVVDLATGNTVLTTPLAAGFNGQYWSHRIALGSDRLYLAVTGLAESDPLDPAPPPGAEARVFALPLNGARIDWQRDLPLSTDTLLDLASVRARNALLVTGRGHGALQLRLFDAATGAPIEQRALACGGGQCWARPHSLALLGDDYRWLENVYTTSTGRQLQTFGADLRVAANLPAGQLGIGGAWYSPASSGQGFVLSWLPGSNTLFAPWFTFAGNQGLDGDEGLRWYSLQGVTHGNDAEVTLQILRNRGGRFAQPPITSAEVVGSASLRFSDCDHASLSFRFNADVEGGRSAVMPWQRIGPRVHPCRDAGGALQAPSLAVVDANGFSARQSGAWFDPATSGQGLMLDVVPADGAQAGLLFGAWFSYDVSDPPNDPTAQDWLVIQGTLAGAQAGTVELPILRVIGGALDGVATGNLFPVGRARISFRSCSEARLEYQFDDSELAAAHARRQGAIELARIGGCGG